MTPIAIIALVFFVSAVLLLLILQHKAKAPTTRPVLISFYGDSITRGDGLDPRPVERRTELAKGAFIGLDYSVGGATVQDATAGYWKLPYKACFSEWIKEDQSALIVIGHAGANALGYPDKIDEYDDLLTAMIHQAQATGKTVVLSGMSWVAAPVQGLPEADSVRILQALADFDDRTEAIAIRESCRFLDLRSVPFNGAVDMLDSVHPGQAYADRISAYVTTQLIEILGASHD